MLTDFPHSTRDLKAAIIGGGLMGHALASVMVAAGADVSVVEPDLDLRLTLLVRMNCILAEMDRRAITESQIHSVASLDGLSRNIQLVIEAIPEVLLLKQELFAQLESLFPEAVLATNSSVFRVGDVAALMHAPYRAIGTHWWNPPHLIPIVEVIQGTHTRPDIVDWVIGLLHKIGKTPVHVRKDTPGFIGNRLQHALWREALAIVEEGLADVETVDLVARGTVGLKLGGIGPLENADYVGLDLTQSIHSYLLPTLSRSVVPSPLLLDAIKEHKLGAKTGAGLKEWPKGLREEVAVRLGKHVRAQIAASK